MIKAITMASAREFVVSPQLKVSGKRLITWLAATIIFVFAITNIDRVSGLAALQDFVVHMQEWLRDDNKVFQGQVWRLVTHLWLHSNLKHLAGNLSLLLVFWWTASHYYNARAWFGTYICAGVISGLGYIVIRALWHAHFSQWHGSLSGYFMQDTKTLEGASGAIFAMFGMVVAASLRLCLMRKRQVVDILKCGPLFLVNLISYSFWKLCHIDPLTAKKHEVIESSKFGPPVLIFILAVLLLNGLSDPTIGTLSHVIGAVVGLAAGMILPMQVGLFVFGNRPDLVSIEITEHWLNGLTRLKMALQPSFNDKTDVLVINQCFVDYKFRFCHSNRQVLAGNASVLGDKPVLIACSSGLLLPDHFNPTQTRKKEK